MDRTSLDWIFRRQEGSSVRSHAVHSPVDTLQHPAIGRSETIPQPSVIRRRIKALASIAAAHHSSVTSAEVLLLLPIGAFESTEELESFVANDPVLGADLVVREGEIGWRNIEGAARGVDQVAQSEQRRQFAEGLSHQLVLLCPWIRLIGISGSTSYGRTSPDDDVDFFVVTRRNRVWITLLFAMLVARYQRGSARGLPVFCFNRILEEDRCKTAFRTPQDPLFAREALNLRVLDGTSFHQELLHSASWMEHIFPELYRAALMSADRSSPVIEGREAHFWFVANLLARAILAPYLTMVGMWRNRRLNQRGNPTARFRTIIEPGFFAYESEKYDLLRRMYQEAFEWP